MQKKSLVIFTLLIVVILGTTMFLLTKTGQWSLAFLMRKIDLQPASLAKAVSSPFLYNFAVDGILHETGSMDESSSPYWWLNSGGKFILAGGLGKTVQAELPVNDKWRMAYAASSQIDTDNGYHPQNLFRLITRSKWQNFQQEVYFKINKLNFSASANRDASNGVLLFNRYLDGNNLYYTGIRVDGYAVIKKKINGIYFTMASQKVYTADALYNRDTNPNLIPGQKWLGLRSEIKTNTDGTVAIKVYMDKQKNGQWQLVVQAIDDGKTYGGPAITNEGYAGIRTDFMDVEFDDYRLTTIN